MGFLSGTHRLMAKLLYGSGLRLVECVRLRVKDVDFAQHQFIVRDGKGMKDRVATPSAIALPRTCWKAAATSARCRSYWATRM